MKRSVSPIVACVTAWVCTLSAPAHAQQGEAFLRPGASASSTTKKDAAWIERAEPYRTLIANTSRTHGLEEALVLAVIEVESGFDPEAVSHAGARGLMQLMPVVEREYGVTDVFEPRQNVETGCAYLARLLSAYRGRLAWALAAYNAGPGRVRRAGGPPSHVYVRRVLRARARWRQRLGVTHAPGDFEPSSDTVHTTPKRGPDER